MTASQKSEEHLSKDITDLVPEARELASQLLDECASQGIEICSTATLRTCHEQDELYAQGRTRPGSMRR